MQSLRSISPVWLFLLIIPFPPTCVGWQANFNPSEVVVTTVLRERVHLVLSDLSNDIISNIDNRNIVQIRTESYRIAVVENHDDIRFTAVPGVPNSFSADFYIKGVFLGDRFWSILRKTFSKSLIWRFNPHLCRDHNASYWSCGIGIKTRCDCVATRASPRHDVLGFNHHLIGDLVHKLWCCVEHDDDKIHYEASGEPSNWFCLSNGVHAANGIWIGHLAVPERSWAGSGLVSLRYHTGWRCEQHLCASTRWKYRFVHLDDDNFNTGCLRNHAHVVVHTWSNNFRASKLGHSLSSSSRCSHKLTVPSGDWTADSEMSAKGGQVFGSHSEATRLGLHNHHHRLRVLR